MATVDEIVVHVERLAMVVRSAHLKRALTCIDKAPSLNFWRLIYGNLLDVAVLEMVQGLRVGRVAEPLEASRS